MIARASLKILRSLRSLRIIGSIGSIRSIRSIGSIGGITIIALWIHALSLVSLCRERSSLEKEQADRIAGGKAETAQARTIHFEAGACEGMLVAGREGKSGESKERIKESSKKNSNENSKERGKQDSKERGSQNEKRGIQIALGKIDWESGLSDLNQEKELRAILCLFKKLAEIVESGDLQQLPSYVSRSRGVYVDLKAHWSYDRLLKEIASKQGYLYNNLLKSNLLKSDADSSVGNILSQTRAIRVDVHIEKGALQCELKLYLIEMPDRSYYLNNPVFIKERGNWYIYRLL